jgi:ribosomal protein S18 acetylase RimI-like enzyme
MPASQSAGTIRSLRPDDLDAVVAIDRGNVGRSRRGFFEKRLTAVKRDPDLFITLGVEHGGALAGFVFARIFRGEIGTTEPTASIDAIGVDPAHQGQGLGASLMAGLEGAMRKRGIHEVMSQDLWSNAELNAFFAASGFELAPRWVLERPLAEPVDF